MQYVIAQCSRDEALERSLRDRTPVEFVVVETSDDINGEPPMTPPTVPFVTLNVIIEDVANTTTIKRVFPELDVREGELVFVGTDNRGRKVAGINATKGPLFIRER